MTKLHRLSAAAGLAVLSFIVYLFLPPQSPLSPLAHNSPFSPSPPPSPNFTILGFLPYWNFNKATAESLSSVTALAYFTLHLDNSGRLVKLDNPREQDPGFTNYRRLLKRHYSPLILTFLPSDQTALASILSQAPNRQQAIRTILALLSESHAGGVNIDFEPLNNTPPSLRDNFTLFIRQLSESLSSRHSSLFISIYPSAASRPRIWDLSALTPSTHYFIIMAYDYHSPNEPHSGPNAPLRGAGTIFKDDILTNLAEITTIVPSKKILLGIPFYGYEWDTDTNVKYAPTTTRGSVASLERIQQLIDSHALELLWDRNSLTPYAIRRKEGKIISQIYYESIDSIRLKLELVKSANLGGIAIWALGYEGDNPALWSTIRSLNSH